MSVAEIAPDTLRGWLATGEVRLFDVRDADEFARRHIAGARPMPLSALDPGAIDSSPRAVLYCRTGRRSLDAAHRLLAGGAQEVAHLAGGIQAWQAAGLPIVENPRVPISLQRQVQIAAGSLIFTGTLLGAFVSPLWLLLSGGAGAGLLVAGLTDTCAMARLLERMPWNRMQNRS